jgi:PAS domain S-box-containing protein
MQHPNPYTILAVSGELETLTATLKAAHYDVLSATNTDAALKLGIAQKPDLIIFDLSHPSIDGPTLYRQIRSKQELAQTPVLVINKLHLPSATTFLDNQSTLHEDFLEYRYEPIELVTRIARLIEHKRSHDELSNSRNRYINLFENAADIVYTHDLQGRYTSLNKKGQEITGYSLETITSIDFKTLASPEDINLAKEMLRRKLEDGETSTVYEISILAKDGSVIPVEVSTQLIFENDKPVGVQGIARDIRARKQAEQQLRDAEHRAITEYKILVGRIAKLGEVLSSARDLKQIFIALLEFSKLSLPCNSLGIALYNHEHVELTPHFLWVENKIVDLTNVKPIPVTLNSDIRSAILSAKTLISTTTNLKHPIPATFGYAATDIKPASTMTVPMTIMGRTIGILEIQSSERAAYQNEHTTAIQMAANMAANTIENVRLLAGERQHELQLRQSQKMEAIGHLASGVAHDFNNIITAIYGYCDVALREIPEDHPLRKLLEDIRACGKRAALQTKQLLAFSRKQIAQPVNLNLNDLIKDLESFISRLITEDISITSRFTEGLPEIRADKGQIEQILINLIINARDAMPQGGRITIATSLVYPEQPNGQKRPARPPAPQIQLTLADTGIGMSAEVQQQIFEPFFTTKEEGKGTGLGLSTAYASVKQAGGSIWVDSKEEHGTTFTMRFPVAREQLSQLQETPLLTFPLIEQTKQTILVAEDDATVREVILATLAHVGFNILEATNGVDALDIFQECPNDIHLLLTDVLMPEMNGRQLAQRIHKQRPDMPVVYISGHSPDSINERGALLEGLNFLEKPFDKSDLIRKVQETLALRHTSVA